MSVRQIPMSELDSRYQVGHMIPQAIISKPVSYLENNCEISVHEDYDDFDLYEGAAMIVDGGVPIAVKRYRGHPPQTMTIYVPEQMRDIETITALVKYILLDFHLSEGDLLWQRASNPDY